MQEVIRYLAEEGLISPQGEIRQPSTDIPIEMKIPDGLRDVIGKRLSRLSESCNRVLAVAAVIGRDFRLDVLQKVASIPDEELFKALEEATEGRGDRRESQPRWLPSTTVLPMPFSARRFMKRLLPRGESGCISRWRERWKKCMQTALRSTPLNWPSTSPTRQIALTWGKQ